MSVSVSGNGSGSGSGSGDCGEARGDQDSGPSSPRSDNRPGSMK